MKKFISIILAATPIMASAETITCTFTEPFVTSTYQMNKSVLTYTGFEGSTVLTDVYFQIKGPATFELVKDGKVLQHLVLNYQGSNGMSDRVYPYDVKDNSEDTRFGYGGCESDLLK